MRRIYLLDLDGRDQLDTDPRAVPGSELPQARVHDGCSTRPRAAGR